MPAARSVMGMPGLTGTDGTRFQRGRALNAWIQCSGAVPEVPRPLRLKRVGDQHPPHHLQRPLPHLTLPQERMHQHLPPPRIVSDWAVTVRKSPRRAAPAGKESSQRTRSPMHPGRGLRQRCAECGKNGRGRSPDQSDEGRRRRLGYTPGAAAHGASSASSAETWPRRTSRSRQIVSTSR